MEILRNMRLLVQVRDPRDCITSSYFSLSLSHKLPDDPEKLKAFLAQRQKITETSIDEFALSSVSGYIDRLEKIKNIVNTHDDVLLLKYEDMVESTPKWLDEVSQFIEQPITPDLKSRIKKLLNFNVPSEDPNRHKRQVKPGDHKRKLKSETIEAMNERLSDVLDAFGYQK